MHSVVIPQLAATAPQQNVLYILQKREDTKVERKSSTKSGHPVRHFYLVFYAN
jgi:hypothetical protein